MGASDRLTDSATATPVASTSTPIASVPLTKSQAAAEYAKLVDRTNRLASATGTDASDDVPFTQFQADSRAYVKAVRVLDRKLLSVNWPSNVEPWVRAMVTTFDVANIACAEVEIAAGSYTAATTVADTNAACAAALSQTDPNEIRSLLGLPPATS
jgi:hypothetical protein